MRFPALVAIIVAAAASAAAQTAKTIRAFIPIVTRVQGVTTFFYSSLDVTNHSGIIPADVRYAFVSADNQFRREGSLVTLQPLTTFHTDDFVKLLADRGELTAAQSASLFGTLMLSASDPGFTSGNEISAVVRVWNYSSGSSGATLGLAFRAMPMQAARNDQLISIIRDTSRGGSGPVLVTNLGIANTGLTASLAAASDAAEARLTFYDARSGAQIGDEHVYSLAPGQVMQLNDVFRQFTLPAADDVVARVDGADGGPQLAGYVVLKDNVSNDGSFFEMTAAPPPPPLPGTTYDGTWEGLTAGGSAIRLVVVRNSITSVSMPFAAPTPGGTCRGTGTMTPLPPVPITARGFVVNYSAGGHSTTLKGSFSTPSEGSMVWGADSYGGIFCGYFVIGGSTGSVTVTLKKK